MKIKISILAAMLSTGLLAQQDTNVPALTPPAPAAPAPATPEAAPIPPAPPSAPAAAPAKKPVKKPAKRKPARKVRTRTAARHHVRIAESKTTPLTPGLAVVSANHVNVRGRAGLIGEVVTHLTNGEPVNVIEEIHLKHSGPEEPSAWAKISLPSDAHVWVNATYIDPASKTVRARKLNFRAGPSEMYPVLGRLVRGDSVNEIETKGGWMKIEAPTNAVAFVAAEYLTQEPAALAAAMSSAPAPAPEQAAPAQPTPPPTTLAETPAVAPPPAATPAPEATPTPSPVTPSEMPAATNEVPAPAPVIAEETPPPPRIVEHEGIVRHTFSIQAPTRYELINPTSHRPINYLYTSSTNLDLSRYKGLHIIVTGQEGLDDRWKETPVLTIKKIQVLE